MAAASPTGSSATSTAVASRAALTRIATALTRPKAAIPLAAKRVRGAEQAVEPHGGEGLGDDDEQFEGDAGAGERLVLDQVGECRAGVVGREELRPDEQETECAGDGEAEVEQPGHAGGTDQRVHRGSFGGRTGS